MKKKAMAFVLLLALLFFGSAYASTDADKPFEINVTSFDVYDVVPWDEMKHRMFVNAEENELPSYGNLYLVNAEEYAIYEAEKPDFVVLWLRFDLSVNEGNIRLNDMIFSEREKTGICCRMYSNHFWIGGDYCDILQEGENVKDSLFVAICAEEYFSSEETAERIFGSSTFFCDAEYITNEGMPKKSEVKVGFDDASYHRMYCSDGISFCAYDLAVLDTETCFASQIQAVKEAWNTLPESVYSDLQIHPEKYKLVRLFVHANKNMFWNAYQLQYTLSGKSDCVWVKKWNQSSNDMVFAYDADDVYENGVFDREVMLLINCESIDMPVDEFVRTLEIRVSFSTEIVGDDGGITLAGPRFYEKICMQKQ